MHTHHILPVFLIVLVIGLVGCSRSKEEEAFTVFNEGVTLSLQAGEHAESGDMENFRALNAQAIDKYKKTLQIDSSHGLARSVLGHSYYMQKDFQEGIYWFEQANRLDTPTAVNYREMGLCRINLGQIKEGHEDLIRAFALDGGREIRDITVLDLQDISHAAFVYGESYEAQQDTARSAAYKRFSVGVLMLAYTVDSTRKDIAETIARYTDSLGDTATAASYRNRASQSQ